MSDPKDFLSRWSQRKLKPAAETSAPEQKAASLPAEGKEAATPPAAIREFDITTLPSIDSITANSDISAFLQRGVPASLTRAALRRVWSADPAIRDFIGLSENSWDFNAPDSIPGFGSLTADEVRHAAAQFFGTLTEEKSGQPLPQDTQESTETVAETKQPAESNSKPDASAALGDQRPVDVAVQQDEPAKPAATRRRHGSAIPE